MNEPKTESLSFRVSKDLKEQFHQLFDETNARSKSDLLKSMIEKFNNNDPPKSEPEPDPALNTDPVQETDNELNLNPTETNEIRETALENEETNKVDPLALELEEIIEVKVNLNPIQLFAIKETILRPGFINDTNELVKKVDEGLDTSFWGNELFSGIFSGVFQKMDTDRENDESLTKNIAAALINLFMMQLINGPGDYLEGPVTRKVLKSFIQEQKFVETKDEQSGLL